MPIYEYRCAACGHELEALQKLSDAPLRDCPACHQAELRKRVSAAGFQLKGSGWYVTDFRNSGAKPSGKTNGAAGAATASGEAKTGEAKSGDAASGAATQASGDAAAAKPTTTTSTEKS